MAAATAPDLQAVAPGSAHMGREPGGRNTRDATIALCVSSLQAGRQHAKALPVGSQQHTEGPAEAAFCHCTPV